MTVVPSGQSAESEPNVSTSKRSCLRLIVHAQRLGQGQIERVRRIRKYFFNPQRNLDDGREKLAMFVQVADFLVHKPAVQHLENRRVSVRAGNDGRGGDDGSVVAAHAGGAIVLDDDRGHPGFIPHGAAQTVVAVGNRHRKIPRAAGDEAGVVPGPERQHHHEHQGRHVFAADDELQDFAEPDRFCSGPGRW